MRTAAGLLFALFALGLSTLLAPNVSALSVRIAPLQYEAELKAGENKKGYVDVVNTSAQTSIIRLSVRAFTQTDNEGSLKFYEDEAVQAGVKLDLAEIELAPGEGARVFFMLEGSSLPEGDVFAAILASNSPADERPGVNTATSVGTLLIIQNGTPTAREAAVTSLNGSWLQIGEKLSFTMGLKNTAPAGQNTGFFPSVTLNLKPYNEDTLKGPLVFAGRTRQVEYRTDNALFGPVYIQASASSGGKDMWVFAMTGFWRWLGPLLIVAIAVLVFVFYKRPWRRNTIVFKR